MNVRRSLLGLFIVAVVLGLTLLSSLVHLLTQSWWFDAVGLASVFWTRIIWQILAAGVTLAVYGGFLLWNYRIAMNITRHRSFEWLEKQGFGNAAEAIARSGAMLIILFVAVSGAIAASKHWETLLKFFNATTFDLDDPIYNRDISFYVFRLPLYKDIQNGLIALVIITFALCLAIYLLKGAINRGRNWQTLLSREIKTHLSIFASAIAILGAVDFWIERYDLLYSAEGSVFGAGYTDVHARLQAYWVMCFVTLSLAILLIASLWRRSLTWPIYGIIIYFITLIVVGELYPWAQQRFIVEPNELVKEKPYITHNIAATRKAYNLDKVTTENYVVENNLTRNDLNDNQATLRNIRLWDYRPLLSTYRQLQEIRLYYHFSDVDIDRYTLDGDYRQVMLSPREMSQAQLPKQAQTWVNQRLKYTHGYGAVMSPVNVVTPEGLPRFFIQDIPPEISVDLAFDQPAIYYGEETQNYVFTGMSTNEFDYPQGDENAATRYAGTGGVAIGSWVKRLAYAFDLGSLQTLVSNYFTNESRILYHRNILERVRQVAPFLRFDSDPYISIIDGKLQWIIDAYTVSDRYPYAEPVVLSNEAQTLLQQFPNLKEVVRGNVNYIRNSVKITIDAYNGSLQFYVMDDTDPILQTYQRIFPNLFTANTEIPPSVRDQFRYPLDLFKIQAQMYLTYHMDNPEVFYNREDLWRFPTGIYEGTEQLLEPYYIIMSLPEQQDEEFMLILPFTPVNKDNAIAWMAARSDGEDYGKVLLYEFPKQELIYGPSQIEARIDQNPEISQQLTLWSQKGSRVIRGDLLIIPVERSLLYVEPIYLRAEQGELPELRRVIVAYANQIVMAETLDAALVSIFGQNVPTTPETPISGNTSSLVQQAISTYNQAQAALQAGDWTSYGQYQQELGEILQQLNQN
ncbi:MAG: UPF0182 family protein [Jaaginema sp. PMC 1079.18]|nr:UPF0182 family protein [Jaaginema sp. PMC 1080.18]MEC4851791.1 UPF0182 family protein [Jaaginema sp. PMC 1079.18]MEC4867621.1 UPF0182 family protein [Jaaginema sp. PMC 1078.18]